MSDAHLKLENQLCFRLYNVSKEITRRYTPILKNYGLTYPQYLVLLVLWQANDSLKVNEIGQQLNLDSGTLSPLLKRLEANDIIVRKRSESDERTVMIALSEKGKALKSEIKCVPVALKEMSPLTDSETLTLVTLLDKMSLALQQ